MTRRIVIDVLGTIKAAQVSHRHESNWRDHAACQGMSRTAIDALFFGDEHDSVKAKDICATCPVTEECLDYAMREHIEYGVWGGMTSANRRALARRRRQIQQEFLDDIEYTLNAVAANIAGD